MRALLAALLLFGSTSHAADFDVNSVQKLWALPYPTTQKDAQGHDLIHVRIYPHEQKVAAKSKELVRSERLASVQPPTTGDGEGDRRREREWAGPIQRYRWMSKMLRVLTRLASTASWRGPPRATPLLPWWLAASKTVKVAARLERTPAVTRQATNPLIV